MKNFFEKRLGAILVVITITFFTFHGGRASESDVDKMDLELRALITETVEMNKETSILANDNARAISQLVGYQNAQSKDK